MNKNKLDHEINVIVATDCGSTTTKAILIEKIDNQYRQTFRGEAPTTVEAPHEDVTRGVLNALAELEELSGRKILDGEKILEPAKENQGVDIYVSTSSAGGGLQMVVSGVVQNMTAESAQRAALGAGAIVMDVLASNDGRLPHQKIERVRQLRPDMILLSGGTDGGTVKHVVELAEFIAAARPNPRLGHSFQLPVIYAGNTKARSAIENTLSTHTALTITENLRPTMEQENLFPAREKIQELFLEHVMAQAPGYPKLLDWVGAPVMPTPAAVGLIMQTIAKKKNINVVGVDIGGATTDVFSVFGKVFNRTVSANLGMSYSISNVLAEAGLENVMRWVLFDLEEVKLRDGIKNKMVRPTTIPQTQEDLIVEQALAREALRLAFDQHCMLATGLKGVRQERTISEAFDQTATGISHVNMMSLDLLVGSGGVLSHAPRRSQSMMMMIDAFQPVGFTQLAVDSIFMMPHLGVLSSVNEKAATDVFEKDCLIYLGTCIAPYGKGKPGTTIVKFEIDMPHGHESINLALGEIRALPLKENEMATVIATPVKGFDLGGGSGKPVENKVRGGEIGLVLDGRGRPIIFQKDRKSIRQWSTALETYSDI